MLQRLPKKSVGKRLGGNWDGSWRVEYPDGKKRKVADSLTLMETRNGTVHGHGQVPSLGEYHVQGRNSQYCALISFTGVEDREDLAGVALFKKFPLKGRLEGHWVQLDKDGDMIGGTVILTKRK